jgi:hypothetical protein
MFEGYTNIYIEGYLLQNYDLINRILELAKAAEMNIIWDLASYNIVEEHKTFLTETVLSADRLSVFERTGSRGTHRCQADEALDLLATKTKFAGGKTGANGAMAKRGK